MRFAVQARQKRRINCPCGLVYSRCTRSTDSPPTSPLFPPSLPPSPAYSEDIPLLYVRYYHLPRIYHPTDPGAGFKFFPLYYLECTASSLPPNPPPYLPLNLPLENGPRPLRHGADRYLYLARAGLEFRRYWSS